MNPQSSAALRFGQRTQITGDPGFDLTSLDTTPLPDGCEVVVLAAPILTDIFILVKSATTAADGVNIIAPVSGPGRWLRYSLLLPGLTVSSVHGENSAPDTPLTDGPTTVTLATTPPILVGANDLVQPFARVFVINAGAAGTVDYLIRALHFPGIGPFFDIDAVEDECPAGNDRVTTLAGVQVQLPPDAYTFEMVASKSPIGCTPVCPAVGTSIVNGAQLTVNVYRR